MAKQVEKELTREEIILQYLPRVKKQINAYIRKHPNQAPYKDDFLGEAQIKLVEVVDKYLAGKVDKFSYYLRLTIIGGIADFLRRETLIPTRSTKPAVVVFGETGQLTARPVPELTYEEAFDTLLHTIKGPRDAKIFQARWDGLSIAETATHVGVSKQTVVRRLRKMKERYDQAAKDQLGVD